MSFIMKNNNRIFTKVVYYSYRRLYCKSEQSVDDVSTTVKFTWKASVSLLPLTISFIFTFSMRKKVDCLHRFSPPYFTSSENLFSYSALKFPQIQHYKLRWMCTWKRRYILKIIIHLTRCKCYRTSLQNENIIYKNCRLRIFKENFQIYLWLKKVLILSHLS